MSNEDFFARVGTATTGHSNRSNEVPEEYVDPDDKLNEASKSGALKRWSANDTIFWGSKETYTRLPAGLYKCGRSDSVGYILDKQAVKTDELIAVKDSPSFEVLEEVKNFWSLKEEFVKRKLLHKRGILLYGPPASGKTSTIQLLIKMIIEQYDGIAVYIDHPNTAAGCLQMIRKIEPERPIIALEEDLDSLVERYGENEYLALLDGESQVDNIVHVASTNYPERLDRRFVDRPCRFDTIMLIGMPNSEERRVYIQFIEPGLNPSVIDDWVEATDGFSYAHLRELVVLCQCYKKPFDVALDRLRSMQDRKPKSTDAESTDIGFGTNARIKSKWRASRTAAPAAKRY